MHLLVGDTFHPRPFLARVLSQIIHRNRMENGLQKNIFHFKRMEQLLSKDQPRKKREGMGQLGHGRNSDFSGNDSLSKYNPAKFTSS